MKRTEIAALYGSPETFGDTQVTVCGWARSIRDSKALGFIDLNDGSCFKGVQIVFTAEKLENYKGDPLPRMSALRCVSPVRCCSRRKRSNLF